MALLLCTASGVARPPAASSAVKSTDARYRVGPLLYSDDFRGGMGQWAAEEERPGKVQAANGVLDIDVPAGLTLWFRHRLDGPVMITYDATVISAAGPNDRMSDLNCFWMATDPAHPNDILAGKRTGKFSDYDSLLTYYVGQGGNGNTTTRFRRYIGSKTLRPLLPQNDLSSPATLIVPNRVEAIRLVADGPLIQYYGNGQKIFEMIDPHPYTSGWFAIRTVDNHMQVRNLRIYRLIAARLIAGRQIPTRPIAGAAAPLSR